MDKFICRECLVLTMCEEFCDKIYVKMIEDDNRGSTDVKELIRIGICPYCGYNLKLDRETSTRRCEVCKYAIDDKVARR